jgi:hypothetical protein
MKNKITLNFGTIKDSVSKKSAVEIMRHNETDTLFEFKKSIESSSALRKQHILFKNIESSKPFEKERLAERFLQQNLKMIGSENWNDLIRENSNLRQKLFGAPDQVHILPLEKNAKLFESIQSLLESQTNPNFNDFQAEAEAYNYVISHLTRETQEESETINEDTTDAPNFTNAWKYMINTAVSNFDERYAHLTESEREVFRILIAEGDMRLTYIKNIKEELNNVISEKLEKSSTEEESILQSFKAKVGKEVSEEEMMSDEYIFECAQLLSVLKED